MTIHVICLVANLLMFIDTWRTWRTVRASGQNHGSIEWTWMRVRAKGCLVTMQLLFLIMSGDRMIRLIFESWHPDDLLRFFSFGWLRVLASLLAFATAHANMVSYRAIKKEQKVL